MGISNTSPRRVTLATSGATTVATVTSAGANTWTQVIASTTSTIWIVGISVYASTAAITYDVGVGAAASEVAVASVWTASQTNPVAVYIPLTVPVRIPSGNRVSFRISSSGALVNAIVYALESQVI